MKTLYSNIQLHSYYFTQVANYMYLCGNSFGNILIADSGILGISGNNGRIMKILHIATTYAELKVTRYVASYS